MSEDFVHNHIPAHEAYNCALHDIQETLRANGKTLESCYLPSLPNDFHPNVVHDNDIRGATAPGKAVFHNLNDEQKTVFQCVRHAVLHEDHRDRLFHLDG